MGHEYLTADEWNALPAALRASLREYTGRVHADESFLRHGSVSIQTRFVSGLERGPDSTLVSRDPDSVRAEHVACDAELAAVVTTARHAAIRAGKVREGMLHALFRSMLSAGCDPGSVRVTAETLDRTWGDKTGWRVVGRNAECVQRVGTWIATWIQKHRAPHSSYDCQVSGTVGELVWDGGNEVRVDVSEAYYPCAD